jgi:hypothetical protein
MLTRLWFGFVSGLFLLALCASTGAAEPAASDATPILWKGVEVVTNDFGSIERIRQATAVTQNAVLSISDRKLKTACDAVRGRFPGSKVDCSHVIEPAADGRSQGWYIVEVDIPEREPLRCLAGARLDPRLATLSQQWLESVRRLAPQVTASGEHVNEHDHLDYDNPELSALAARIHRATRDRTVELEAVLVSCNARERTHSFHLINFAGDPQKFISMAAARSNDEDSGAAKAAMQFLSTFAQFIEPSAVPHVASEVCKSVLEGGFTARQQSLSLLIRLRNQSVLSLQQLGSDCQRQIRDIARTSLALPARELVNESTR